MSGLKVENKINI